MIQGNMSSIQLHVGLAMLTVGVLSIAGLSALLLALQEWLVRSRYAGPWVQKLPPLETMETRLFFLNRCGFILLTAVLITSLYSYHTLLREAPWLLPKTMMAVAAWLIFLILLLGRHYKGWRAARAINSTLFGALLLIAIYFASHLELL